MANTIPSDTHAIGDPGHTADHNNVSDVLGLLAAVAAVQGNSDAVITTPPAGNATAVSALSSMLTHRSGYYPWRFSVVTYGAAGNGQMVIDGAMNGTTGVLTCATSAPFTPADVGKAIIVNGALAATSALCTTIASYTSATQVTLTAVSAAAVSSACVMWGTDDTAAFQAAINAATTFMNNANLSAEVYKPQPPGGLFYMIAGPLVNTGSANGQLVIPNPFSLGEENLTLAFTADITRSLSFWTQTAWAQVSNAIVSTGVFASAGAYTTNFASFAKAGVISSTPSMAGLLPLVAGLPAFANIHVVFDNWTILTPSSANGLNYSAFQMGGTAKSEFSKCAALTTANYNATSGANQFPAIGTLQNGLSTGFIPSGNGNNDDCFLENPTVSGYAFGIQCGEHCHVVGGREIGCWAAFLLSGQDPVSNAHMTKITGNSMENCFTAVYVAGQGASGFCIDADIDLESLGAVLADNSSGTSMVTLMGEIRIYGQLAGVLNAGGGFAPKYPVYVKLHAMTAGTGTVSSVPGWVFGYGGFSTAGSNVAVQNPYWKDARVYWSGGTVTAAKAGVTLGGTGGSATTAPAMTTVTTAAAGDIDWPCGGWLSFTWTGTPAWNVLVGY